MHRRAFTVMELLVSIAIVGLLIALVVLGTGGGLVYAAMLISPGKKLF